MTKNRKQLQRTNVQVQTEHRSFSIEVGPLPPPATLEKYDQIVPGAAERIIKMAEAQSAHRIDLESRVIKSDIMNSKIGLIFGFVLGVIGIIGGIVLLNSGKTIEGSAVGGATVASLVGTFVYGSRQRRNERTESQKLLQR